MSYREAVAKSFIVDNEVKEFIKMEDRDFRICTSCSGPVMVPTDLAPIKSTDVEVKVGENSLFVSIIQARFTRRIHSSMLDQYQHMMSADLNRCELD
ncbi:MAG: hypothetical protein KAR76_00100 [Methanosarcinales archaeon]|nr:hypothetical protein [Methanosarcinales archaeon]